MATKRNAKKTKSGTRGKKLARAKQMKEVKPLAIDAFMSFTPVSTPLKD
jgi:hypothetical protein